MSAEALLRSVPLVAILRGLRPESAIDVGQSIFDAGFRVIEVPLNSPDPFASIRKLSDLFGERCLCGAGTVLTPLDVKRTHDAGGRLVVAPNVDARVIAAALSLDMIVMPGFQTATEAFTAIHMGARHLKLFPAASSSPQHLKSLRDVLPSVIHIYPVGGVTSAGMESWLQAGANGFGFGSDLFRPTYETSEIGARALALAATFDALRSAMSAGR